MAGQPIHVDLKAKGLREAIEVLHSLPGEIVSRRGGVALAALRKGARLLKGTVQANLQRATSNQPSYSTGLLEENVIAKRAKAPFEGNGERMTVGVKRKVYPDSGGVTTRKTLHLLEYGSEKQPAEPVLRPAVLSVGQRVIDVVAQDIVDGTQRAVARLARQKGLPR